MSLLEPDEHSLYRSLQRVCKVNRQSSVLFVPQDLVELKVTEHSKAEDSLCDSSGI